MVLHTIDSGSLRITIDEVGAELSSLVDRAGRELLWQGRSVWKRRAPILFPIIGQMPGGILHYEGVSYPIGQHGFARDQSFEASDADGRSILFTLVDSPETREKFPFRFRLAVLYSVSEATLTVTTTVTNTDSVPFSASLGEHPAFVWPLVEGIARDTHVIEFAKPEPAPIRRIVDGLALVDSQPTPVVGDTLALDDALFVADAVIFDQLASRSVRYSAPGAPCIVVSFPDFPILGVWSKAPGEFVCIEPWFGMTAAQGFSGEYSEKPHQFVLEPDGSRKFTYSVTIEQPAP
ncbi:aldose 1-epimerase family protein [Lacisediminihabitans sp. H27-G8]|uniref:aldose 1-epimerase family protein n=1 Tax=Lacisediminihabitans sp. H27-G8 TaxID=3111909 RepID=UPI0038FCE3E2